MLDVHFQRTNLHNNCLWREQLDYSNLIHIQFRYHSRFFVQVGHKTMYAAIENHHFFTIPYYRQTWFYVQLAQKFLNGI